MYIPKNLAIKDQDKLFDFVKQYNFGVIMSADLQATHLPFEVVEDAGKLYLQSHMARANPHWKVLDNNHALVVFSGPHAYISPSWYAKHPAVPTWNYAAVHIKGRFQLLSSSLNTEVVNSIVAKHEPSLLESSEVLNEEITAKIINGLVSFRIEIEDIQGKQKLGQERRPDDQKGVYHALKTSNSLASQELAQYMLKQQLGLGE